MNDQADNSGPGNRTSEGGTPVNEGDVRVGMVGGNEGSMTITVLGRDPDADTDEVYVRLTVDQPNDRRKSSVMVLLDEDEYRELKRLIAATDEAVEAVRQAASGSAS